MIERRKFSSDEEAVEAGYPEPMGNGEYTKRTVAIHSDDLIVFALEEIIAHLGAAVTQRAPSDDAIIADHIVCALAHAKVARAAIAKATA